MKECPCLKCEAVSCRRRCDAYLEYHDELVDARDSLKRLDTALEDAIAALSALDALFKRRTK